MVPEPYLKILPRSIDHYGVTSVSGNTIEIVMYVNEELPFSGMNTRQMWCYRRISNFVERTHRQTPPKVLVHTLMRLSILQTTSLSMQSGAEGCSTKCNSTKRPRRMMQLKCLYYYCHSWSYTTGTILISDLHPHSDAACPESSYLEISARQNMVEKTEWTERLDVERKNKSNLHQYYRHSGTMYMQQE